MPTTAGRREEAEGLAAAVGVRRAAPEAGALMRAPAEPRQLVAGQVRVVAVARAHILSTDGGRA